MRGTYAAAVILTIPFASAFAQSTTTAATNTGAVAPTTATTPPSPATPPSVPALAPHLEVRRERVLARYAVVDEDKRVQDFALGSGLGRVFRMNVNRPDSISLRFHFQAGNGDSVRQWLVQVVRASDDKVLWAHSGLSGEKDFWSDEVPLNRAAIEVITLEPDTPLHLGLSQVVMTGPVAKPQAIWGDDDRVEIRQTKTGIPRWTDIQQWGRAVARLRFVGDDGYGYYCTAFLIAPDLMLTNDHCIRSDSEMRSALVDFNYISATTLQPAATFKELVAHDPNLDYSLLRLSKPVQFPALPLRKASLNDNQQLVIIEHPAGEVKQVSFKDCVVAGRDLAGVDPSLKSDFGHHCDTLGGSSGSPVMVFPATPVPATGTSTSSGEVVGLHHLGFIEGATDPANQAVRIDLVLSDIRAKRPDIANQLPVARSDSH